MREAYALRVAGRTGRKLDKGGLFGAQVKDFACKPSSGIVVAHGLLFEFADDFVATLGFGKVQQPFVEAGFRIQCGTLQLRQNSKQLQAMFVTNADSDRHRNDATEYRCPECDHKLSV